MRMKQSPLLLALAFALGAAGAAHAQQSGNAVNSGINSDGGAMSGAGINRVNGINANGTPRQQSPGSSMTNGAGNSTMTPGITGTAPAGTVTPQINGLPAAPKP